MDAKWPEFYPPGVPPYDAVEVQGEFYRLVNSCPPVAEDFLSTLEENPERRFDPEIMWMACGLSVHREQADAARTRERYRALRGKRIAAGRFPENSGRMKATPTAASESHHTVWLRAGTIAQAGFECRLE